jgi:hypothetical protein
MKFWSEGLGKRDLVMELAEASLDREGEGIILTGTIHQPAEWAYKVTMGRSDWNVVLTTATSAEACTYLSRSVSVAKILSMGIWVVKFILLMGFYRLGSLLGLVDLDRDAMKPIPLAVGQKTLKAIPGGAVERRNTA